MESTAEALTCKFDKATRDIHDYSGLVLYVCVGINVRLGPTCQKGRWVPATKGACHSFLWPRRSKITTTVAASLSLTATKPVAQPAHTTVFAFTFITGPRQSCDYQSGLKVTMAGAESGLERLGPGCVRGPCQSSHQPLLGDLIKRGHLWASRGDRRVLCRCSTPPLLWNAPILLLSPLLLLVTDLQCAQTIERFRQ